MLARCRVHEVSQEWGCEWGSSYMNESIHSVSSHDCRFLPSRMRGCSLLITRRRGRHRRQRQGWRREQGGEGGEGVSREGSEVCGGGESVPSGGGGGGGGDGSDGKGGGNGGGGGVVAAGDDDECGGGG